MTHPLLGPLLSLLFRFILFLTRDVRGAGTEASPRDGEFGDVGRRGVGDGARGLKQPHQPLNLGLTTLQHFQQDLRKRDEIIIVIGTILFNIKMTTMNPACGGNAFSFVVEKPSRRSV